MSDLSDIEEEKSSLQSSDDSGVLYTEENFIKHKNDFDLKLYVLEK